LFAEKGLLSIDSVDYNPLQKKNAGE